MINKVANDVDPKLEKNRAVVISKIDDIQIRDWPLKVDAYPDSPHYKPGDPLPSGKVLLRIRSGGICGSDIHFWKEGRAGPDIIREPFVVGHEASGEVIQVADDVREWVRGDRTIIKPGLPCLTCDDCTTGQSNICPRMGYNGAPGTGPQDGALCTYKIVSAVQLARLTPKISWVEAGTIQPLAIALQMAKQAGLKANQNVMILGGGCIGLLLGAISKAYGAKQVAVLEIQPHRAEFAKDYCADYVFVNPPRADASETSEAYSGRVAKHILSSVDGLYRGFDVVVEAAGAEECMQIGLQVCRPGGTYVQVGVYNGQWPRIPMMDICSREINVRGTWRYTTNCFEDAISLIDRKLVDVKSLISHVFPFEESLEAFQTVHDVKAKNGRNVYKVVISDDKLSAG